MVSGDVVAMIAAEPPGDSSALSTASSVRFVGSSSSLSGKDEDRRPTKKKVTDMRLVVASTVCGSIVLLLSLIAIATVWIINLENTTEAVDSVSIQFRRKQGETVNQEIAAIFHQVWETANTFADDMYTGGVQRDYITVVPPTTTTFSNMTHLELYHKELFSTVDRNILMRKAYLNESAREYYRYGASIFALALQEDNAPATSLETCAKVVYSEQRFYNDQENHHVDVQFLRDGGVSRMLYSWSPTTFTFEGVLDADVVPMDCADVMAPLWSNVMLPTFGNFSWYVQEELGLGLGDLFGGTVPVYTEDGSQMGRAGFSIALEDTMRTLLQTTMLEGGEMTDHGHAALFSADGIIRGLSEAASTGPTQARTMSELDALSDTSKALVAVEKRYGSGCPESTVFFQTDDEEGELRLIDVTVFDPEALGIPVFPVRWCQIVTVPRSNMYAPLDQVFLTTIIVGVLSGFSFIVAVALLAFSLCLVLRAQRRLAQERREVDFQRVIEADQKVKVLGAPMVLLSAHEFLNMKQMESHEVWRNRGKLVVLDTMEDIRTFKRTGIIVLFSHQWLGVHVPDTEDNVQLKAMQSCVLRVQKEVGTNVFVWMDYFSVSQRHPGAQRMAVSALPAYLSVADRFVICAPSALHRDLGHKCGMNSYLRRGWCRMEMLARACVSGLGDVYCCTGDGTELLHMSKEDIKTFSFNVYEGEFAVSMDREMLVQSMLGLYSLILRGTSHEDVKFITEELETNKDVFFPPKYTVHEAGLPSQKRKLFGDLVRHMEKYVEASQKVDRHQAQS